MLRHVKGGSVVGCLLRAGLLAGCGSSSKSASGDSASSTYAKTAPAQIVKDVIAATRGATSYQADGMIDEGGTNAQVTYAIKLPKELSFSIQEGSVLIKLVALPAAAYFYANGAYWQKQESSLSSAEVAKLANRWYKAPASLAKSATQALGDISPRQLSTCLAQATDTPKVTGTAMINGQPTVVLHFAGGTPGTGPENLYVSAAAPHVPLRLEETGKETPGGSGACASTTSDNGQGQLTFSRWNSVTVTAPPNAAPLPS